MSSYVSTITIDDREWKEIQRKVCDTEIYVTRKNAEADRLRDEIKKREQELKQLNEQAKATVNSAITLLQGGLNTAVNSLSAEAKEAVRKQAQIVGDEIGSLKEDIRSTAAKTESASARVSKISQGYADVVEALVKQENDNAKSARIYLDSMTSLLSEIERLHPEAFEPKTYFEVKDIICSAKENISHGSYKAALINTKTGVMKASSLLTRLILANEGFNEQILKTTELADGLKAAFDQLDPTMGGAIEFEIDGEKYQYEYDINHWSEGRFEALRKAFEAAYEQLQKAKENRAPVSQIEGLRKTFEDLKQRLERCDVIARQELLGSQKAFETALRVRRALPKSWKLYEHGFNENDDRNPYKMIYKNALGNTISVVLSPGVSAEKPNVYLEAFAEDEAEADIIKRDIITTKLPSAGITIEEPRHMNDCQINPNGRQFVDNTIPRAKALNEQRRLRSFGM